MAVTSIVKMLTGTKVRQALLLCLVLLGGRSNAFVLPQNMARTNAPLVPSTSTRKMQLSLEDSFGGISGMLASLELPQSILSQLAGQELPRLTSMDELWLTAVTLVSHLSFLQEALLFIIPVSAVIATAGYRFSFPDDDYRAGIEPYERGCYNPEQARAYYAKHPKVVVQRVLQIYRLSNKFITALLLDKYVFKREEGMREKHAKELLSLITQLGPTAGEGGGAEKVRQRVVAEYRERFPGLNDMELRKRAREEVETRMQEVALRESLATGITTEVEELQRKNQDAFAIPEWFVYTSRAFITLEGVSLQADENYSLIQSCFPYIAKRLVKDEHPRAQQALKELLYGAGDLIDLERLEKLADGFSTYSTSTKAPTAETRIIGNKKSKIEAEAALSLAKDSADVLLDPKGNLVQNLLVEEGALAASARVKDQIREVLVDGPQRLRDSMPLGVGILFPKLPFEEAVAPFVQKTEHEENAQKLVGKIRALVQGRDQQSIDKEALNELLAGLNPEQATLIVRELGQHLPKYTGLVGKLGTKFVAKLFQKASDNIDTTLADLEDKDVDRLMMLAARGVSSMAQHGARLGGGLQLPRTIQTTNKE